MLEIHTGGIVEQKAQALEARRLSMGFALIGLTMSMGLVVVFCLSNTWWAALLAFGLGCRALATLIKMYNLKISKED
ncbi:hypothetical protein CO174_03820 [Candidatus Uhrbacteria bacterium CG_4_9_14_3_um_filter_50_9]|uniref:Uncharacterized protein n=1 Tax=Candidatus Uhrbacteria bacterium CG_4_9_14_3_um_filter_50_9 TaxID=1975035 RepID=A0A2M7XBM8_9BACT|nr:MAG: hypothetical protein CO174_03820 [Candidatus Uhrbacteria bacterium CG_4_9_14_3_um_filter_50_9]